MKKIFSAFLIALFSVIIFIFWYLNFSQKEKDESFGADKNFQEEVFIQNEELLNDVEKNETIITDTNKDDNDQDEAREIKIPFTSQAPSGNWGEDIFQNGCEEASILMVMKFVDGEKFSSPIETEKEIKDISKFEDRVFGYNADLSLDNIGTVFSQYYNFKNYNIKSNIILEDLKKELIVGNIILIPAYGRALKNPNYTSPGPITHMLIVTSYDSLTGKFVTNDPGTRKGEGYKYDEDVLFDAIWEYPSGENHLTFPKAGEMKKGMISIKLR